jgi:hypothetical protein
LLSVPVGDLSLPPAVFRHLDEAGIQLAELALRRPSLDEVFLTLTGRPAAPAGASGQPHHQLAEVSA